jgi:DNA-binding GntR family transcriptional regulator
MAEEVPWFPETKQARFVHEIRRAIIEGELKPGEWIRTADWAKRFRMSQTPVREALQVLGAEGLVRIHPHRGAQVTIPTEEETVQRYRIRAVLEGLAAREAVARSSAEERAQLAQELAAYQEEMRSFHEATDYRVVNYRFHRAVAAAAKSTLLTQMIERLWPQNVVMPAALDSVRHQELLAEHDDLIEAIRRGDADTAEQVLRNHVDDQVRFDLYASDPEQRRRTTPELVFAE